LGHGEEIEGRDEEKRKERPVRIYEVLVRNEVEVSELYERAGFERERCYAFG